ncbi:MAG: hypothetical protein M3N14_01725 [Bacteroidota bacterium]|nr:hypothetical protein [Bacteroidota bacterium]
MKKLIYLSLLFIGFNAQAQKGIVFKMKFLPNHDYNGTVNMNISCKVNLSGDKDVLDKLTAQGITLPVNANVVMKMGGDTKTGARGSNDIFPVTMKFKVDQLAVNLNGKDINVPIPATANATTIFGHAGVDGKLIADSIGGNKMKDTARQKMSQMMNALQQRINFPDRPLHIGDTFTQDMPLGIPLSANMKMDAKTIYKLINITNGNAFFDVTQSMNMAIPVKNETVTLIGSGSGKLIYDIKNSFPIDFKDNMTLKVAGIIEKVAIDATAQFDIGYKYDIH